MKIQQCYFTYNKAFYDKILSTLIQNLKHYDYISTCIQSCTEIDQWRHNQKKKCRISLPYAFPINVVSRKPIVTARVRIMSIQLISGIYIWPYICFDVWTTFTLGKHPRAWHCLIMENVAVMTAWLPTIAARVAITSTGQNTDSVHHDQQRNDFSGCN